MVEGLVASGLTTASAATRQKLDASVKEAARAKLGSLSTSLRYVNDELGRFLSDSEHFSARRLAFFVNRTWLISRGLKEAIDEGDRAALSRLLVDLVPHPGEGAHRGHRGRAEARAARRLGVVRLPLPGREGAGQNVPVGTRLVWSTVFAGKKGVPAEAFLHLPQVQKFTPKLLLEPTRGPGDRRGGDARRVRLRPPDAGPEVHREAGRRVRRLGRHRRVGRPGARSSGCAGPPASPARSRGRAAGRDRGQRVGARRAGATNPYRTSSSLPAALGALELDAMSRPGPTARSWRRRSPASSRRARSGRSCTGASTRDVPVGVPAVVGVRRRRAAGAPDDFGREDRSRLVDEDARLHELKELRHGQRPETNTTTEILREPAEVQYADQLEALQAERRRHAAQRVEALAALGAHLHRRRPSRSRPRSTARRSRCPITRKFFGDDAHRRARDRHAGLRAGAAARRRAGHRARAGCPSTWRPPSAAAPRSPSRAPPAPPRSTSSTPGTSRA